MIEEGRTACFTMAVASLFFCPAYIINKKVSCRRVFGNCFLPDVIFKHAPGTGKQNGQKGKSQ